MYCARVKVLLHLIYEYHKYRPVCVCLQLVDVDLVEKVESLKRQLEEKSSREKEEEKQTISDVVSSDYMMYKLYVLHCAIAQL